MGCQQTEQMGLDISDQIYRDLRNRPGPPNGGLVKDIPLFQGNLGW